MFGPASCPQKRPLSCSSALQLAGAADFRLDIAPAEILPRYAGPLTTLRLACESVPQVPTPQTSAPLAHAQHLVSVGFGRFVTVSGDHLFDHTCHRYPTVIVRHGQPVARVLQQTAVAVLVA